jgi:hypothetical protein
MRPVRISQTSFTAGELAPTVAARIEVARYYAGAERMENLLVRPQGGARRRPGMRHIFPFPAAAIPGIRLIPFAFNAEQTYCIALYGGAFSVFRADGTPLATVAAPWTGGLAREINRAQSGDTLLLVHPFLSPQRIRRGATDATWTIDTIPWGNIPTFDFGSGAEPIMSAARGYPAAITFHQGRLWIGGFRSRPATIVASKVNDFFNLDQGTGLDDQAIVATIDSDQVNAIRAMVSTRELQIFTGGSEHTISGAPITPKTIAITEQSRRGIKNYTTVAEVDGATLFIQAGGAALRQMVYADVEQAWRSDLSSLLAPHLIKAPFEVTARKNASADDVDHVLLTNGDGTVTVMTTLRSQEVAAFTRWETAGTVLSTCALLSGEVFFAVERQGSVRLERWFDGALLDASAAFSSDTPVSAVGGLTHLNGLTVALMADGVYVGTATVAGGAVTLPQPARFVEVGLPFTARLVTMPLEPRDPTGALIGRRARITEISARVNATGYLLVQGQPVILRRLGGPPNAALDTPPPVETGDVTLRGLAGWRERPQVEISQPVPGPLEVLAIATRLELAA